MWIMYLKKARLSIRPIILVVMVLGAVGCGGGPSDSPSATDSSSVPPADATSPSPEPPSPLPGDSRPEGTGDDSKAGKVEESESPDWNGETVTVEMVQGLFEPREITVSYGTRVVWVNKDTDMHNVVARELNLSSPPVDMDGMWETVLTEPGEWDYVCVYHLPEMVGKVTVAE